MNKKKQKAPSPGGTSLPKSAVMQEIRFHDEEPKLIPAGHRAVEFQPIKFLAVGDKVHKKDWVTNVYSVPRQGDIITVHRIILNVVNCHGPGAPTSLCDFTALFYDLRDKTLVEYEYDSRFFERVTEV
jgi:hypothetical protein